MTEEDITPWGLQFREAIEEQFIRAGLANDLIPAARRATYAAARKLAVTIVVLNQSDYESIARLVITYIVSLDLTREDQVEFIAPVIGLTKERTLSLRHLI